MKKSGENSDILVVFYSRTGNTSYVGKKIAKILEAEIDEIIDLKNRGGIMGWLGGGRDAFFKRRTKIKNKKNPEDYKKIIIGSPIWAGTITPAVREYLIKYKTKLNSKKLYFYCTFGGSPGKYFSDAESLSKKSLATFCVKDKTIHDKDIEEKIKFFCNKIK
jgi:flavodoxin